MVRERECDKERKEVSVHASSQNLFTESLKHFHGGLLRYVHTLRSTLRLLRRVPGRDAVVGVSRRVID